MRVLVTGGAGYIGSHLVNMLLKSGYDVVVYDNLSTGFRDSLSNKVPFELGDVRDLPRLLEVIGKYRVEAVFHLAAKLVAPESLQQPIEYYDVNVVGTLRVVEACRKLGVGKLIFSSTAAVYGLPVEDKVSELSATIPINPYGASKLMAERIISDAGSTHSFKYVNLRYFNVAGANMEGSNGPRSVGATHLIKVVTEAAIGSRECIEIFGNDFPTPDGTGVRDYIHVEDLVSAHVSALEYLNIGGGSDVFNVGYGVGSSVIQVVRAIEGIVGRSIILNFQPRRLGDPHQVVADVKKIKRVLGWNPMYNDLGVICKSAIDWERRLLCSKS